MTGAAMAFSAARITGSVVLLLGVLWGVSRLARAVGLAPELARKAIHISLGLYCLTFPWLFPTAWEVVATCTLAVAVFIAARGRLRSRIGEGLHAVDRVSYGEVLFAAAVALLFVLKDGHWITVNDLGPPPMGPVLYVLPLLMLTLCDAASAVVGSQYGRRTFRVERGRKSWEGVAVFVTSGWLLSLIVYLLLTDIDRREVILLAFVTAAFGALLEASSWRGLDNLFIPLGLYFLLANLSYAGTGWLVLVAGAFLASVLVLMALTRRRGESPHLVAMYTSLFFLIATFSGVDSLLTPMLAVAVFVAGRRVRASRRGEDDALSLVVVIVSVALAFFIVSHLLQINTIFAFNVAFACLAVAIGTRTVGGADARDAPRSAAGQANGGASADATGVVSGRVLAAGAMLAATAAMSVRIVVMEGAQPAALRFFAVGCACVLLAALLTWQMQRRQRTATWGALGLLSAGLGLLTLPLSP
jgi:dolichol kinase